MRLENLRGLNMTDLSPTDTMACHWPISQHQTPPGRCPDIRGLNRDAPASFRGFSVSMVNLTR